MSRENITDPELALASQLLEAITASWKSQVLYVAAELRIADLLADGPRASSELAAMTGAHPPSLRRLLRGLAAIGVCSETAADVFGVTPLGALLATDAPLSLRSWTLWWGTSLRDSWGSLLYSVRTGSSARRMLTGMEGFDHLANDPEQAATFNRALVELTRLVTGAVLDCCDFAGVRRVADVGGGHGEMLMAVLNKHPSVSGVLFDLPHAVECARQRFAEAGLLARCEFLVGDFFEHVPAGAEAYLLKSVIHDWDDAKCRILLQNCRRAAGKNGRVLVVEQILPDIVEQQAMHQSLMRSDLSMLVAHGAGERTQAEMLALVQSAGLRVTRVLRTRSTFSVIEAVVG